MAISKKLLNPGERLIISTRQHPKALFLPILALIVFLAVGVAAESYLDDDGFQQVLGYIVWVLVLLGVLWFSLRPFLVWATTVHAFTDRRLITRWDASRLSASSCDRYGLEMPAVSASCCWLSPRCSRQTRIGLAPSRRA